AIRTSWDPLRKAGATARELLISAAAATWDVDRAACRAEQGAVMHTPTQRRLTYGKLAARAAKLPVPTEVPLKDPKDFRLLGTRTPRLDTPVKVDGSAVFGIDVKGPGMLIASIERCPVFGRTQKRYDAAKAITLPGVHAVVALEPSPWTGTSGPWAAGCAAGVAVVADTYWHAVQGRRALQVEWDEGAAATLDSDGIRAQFTRLAGQPGVEARKTGDPGAALTAAAKRVEAVYEVPFLHHATLEPMHCTAPAASLTKRTTTHCMGASPTPPGSGCSDARVPTPMIAPAPASTSFGSTVWVNRDVGGRLRLNCFSNSSSGISCTLPPTAKPPT